MHQCSNLIGHRIIVLCWIIIYLKDLTWSHKLCFFVYLSNHYVCSGEDLATHGANSWDMWNIIPHHRSDMGWHHQGHDLCHNSLRAAVNRAHQSCEYSVCVGVGVVVVVSVLFISVPPTAGELWLTAVSTGHIGCPEGRGCVHQGAEGRGLCDV